MTAAVISLDVERERARLFAGLKDLLLRNPGLMDRTFAALNEEIPMANNEAQIMIRLSADLLAQLEEMVPIVAALPEYAGVGRVTRAFVARLAIVRGLDALRESMCKE